MVTMPENEPYNDERDWPEPDEREEYVGERYCWDCGGRGWKITCIDDLCYGNDECIHGDQPTPCSTCNRNGENEDAYL